MSSRGDLAETHLRFLDTAHSGIEGICRNSISADNNIAD
jgi:hypothetical protein